MDCHGPAKEAILTSVAESIGATLGTIAAKAGSVQKALTEKVSSTGEASVDTSSERTMRKRAGGVG